MSKCILEKDPGLPSQIWDVYYLPSTLGKTLLWSATGGGGLHRLQTFVFAVAKNQRIPIMLRFRAVHLMMPAMTAALRGGGNNEDGSARDGSARDAQLVDSSNGGICFFPRNPRNSAEHTSELNHSRARLICSGIRRNPEFRLNSGGKDL
jgi:hypothetical protein